jgi:UDP-N-acetylglucosamine:LPS N-acetylglucosamine transferase
MKRIDIYTIDIGGGHIAPAQALKQQFDIVNYPNLEVRVVNLGTELPTTFLRFIYKFYWNNALRYPPLVNAFYRGADNPFFLQIIDRILGISILPRFVGYLEREKPDLVVSTYFTFTHYLELLKRVGQLSAVSVVLNPEPFDSHYVWFSPAFDWSMVFSKKSRDEIVEKGIARRKVRVFQFPIKPSFSKRTSSKSALRKRLALDPKPFTVLFFFGAEGVGPVKKFLALLIERGIKLQAVVVCGRNERLARDMESLARGPTGGLSIEVRGFVTNLADFIAAADVVVGKSGPNQVFETLIQERPIIISSFLANEKQTTEWVRGQRVGWLTRTPAQLATLLAKLVRQPRILAEYQANIRRQKIRSGAPEICEFLYEQVNKKRPQQKRTVGDALRRFRDAVVAEGELISKRIDQSEGMQRLKAATDTRRATRARRTKARRNKRSAKAGARTAQSRHAPGPKHTASGKGPSGAKRPPSAKGRARAKRPARSA